MIIPRKYFKTASSKLILEAEKILDASTFLKIKPLANSIDASFIEGSHLIRTKIKIKGESLICQCSCGVYGSTLCSHGMALMLNGLNHEKEGLNEKEKYIEELVPQSLGQLVQYSNNTSNLIIMANDKPQKQNNWEVKVCIKNGKSRYSSKHLFNIIETKSTIKGISLNSFSCHDQEIIHFLVGNCSSTPLLVIPYYLVHSFFLLLTNHPNFYLAKENYLIVSERPKLFVQIINKKNIVVKTSWGVKFGQTLNSYFLVKDGVWLQLDKYYYFPFFSNRSLILSVLKNSELIFSQKNFKSFSKNLIGLKENICFDIQEESKDTTCTPVLQLNWTNSLLEAHLSFEYMNRFFNEEKDFFQIKTNYKKRVKLEENKAKEFIKSLGFIYQDNNFYTLDDLEKIGFFVEFHYKNLSKNWHVYTNKNFDNKLSVIKKIELNINNFNIKPHLFEFDINISVDNNKIDNWKTIFLPNQKKNSKYIILNDGMVICVDKQMRDVFKNIKQYSVEGHFTLPNYMVIPLKNMLMAYITKPQKLQKIYDKATKINFKGMKNINDDLLNCLRLYQRKGISWLQTMHLKRFSCILADEMGLGKTIQSLAFLASQKKSFRTLVISPKSLTYNWQQECQKFTPQLKSIVLNGSKDVEQKADEIARSNLVIVSYRSLHFSIKHYSLLKFDCLILDEAQYIKNYNSLTTKCCYQIKTDFRILLTGTPIENSLLDIWTLFDFILPGILGKQAEFKKLFCKKENQQMVKQLSKIISPFILRRYKKDVLTELPSKQEQKMICELAKEQRELYDICLHEVRQNYSYNKKGVQVFAMLLKLKQICCSPQLIFRDKNIESAKFELLKQIVDELRSSNHRALIFSQFTSMLKIIRQWFDQQKIPYLYLDGTTKNRQNLVSKFNEDETYPFFFISLKAGGVGLNLTGADTVIHYDLWWNPMIEDQATDRAHRIGQKKKVNIIKLVTKDTIEEKIMKIQEKKRKIFYSLIENPNKQTGLTTEDFDFLFN